MSAAREDVVALVTCPQVVHPPGPSDLAPPTPASPPKHRPHRLAARSEWAWMPRVGRGVPAAHPWCIDCGAVKAIGSDRALDIGGLMNLLARLEHRFAHHGLRLTEAQRRLIVQRMRARGVDDTFALTREPQLKAIAGVIAATAGIHAQTVETYLRSC